MLNLNFFHKEIPARPSGKYAHIVMLRETKGYALFQTDGELNRARVSRGIVEDDFMTRIALFNRKQTTPERLNGRELLRNLGILPDECKYNVSSCNRCPDCITYGFAVGDGGSEKSKIFSDSAFSLTDYQYSHEVFTLNAPYEDGTMSEHGQATSRINQKDHVKPQILFPAVMTARDLTGSLFFYVLNNVMRTERYGATTTRGGTVQNHIVAIILSDGEIFSNLLFTQALYDELKPDGEDPVKLNAAISAAQKLVPDLLKISNTHQEQVLMGEELEVFLQSLRDLSSDEVLNTLQQAMSETEVYHHNYIKKTK